MGIVNQIIVIIRISRRAIWKWMNAHTDAWQLHIACRSFKITYWSANFNADNI